MGFQSVQPAALYELLRREGSAVDLIDVRTPAEYRSLHATAARCVPLGSLDPKRVTESRPDPGALLYVICKSGERSARACAAFAAAGYGDRVVNVEGGTLAWAAAGLPVVKGRWVLPLDRQVQTVTGMLVLLGCGLGAFVSPWWYLLAAYCGLGLEFAGLTGICPLGALMARMPWNQAELDPQGGCCG